MEELREIFNVNLKNHYERIGNSTRKQWTREHIRHVIQSIKLANDPLRKKTTSEYYFKSKYDVLNLNNEDILIFKLKKDSDRICRIVPSEDYFDILVRLHQKCNHGGRDKMIHEIGGKYYLPKKGVEIFLPLCAECQEKRERMRGGGKILKKSEGGSSNTPETN